MESWQRRLGLTSRRSKQGMIDTVADPGVILAEAAYRDIRGARFEVAVLPGGPPNLTTCNPAVRHGTSWKPRRSRPPPHGWPQKGVRASRPPIIPFGVNTGQMDLPSRST